LLGAAGLSGAGLNRLLSKSPPLDLQKVRAVILYAEARGLKAGYIYRHLDSNAPVAEPFTQFAALDDETLSLFRQGIKELKVDGIFWQPLLTPIPLELTDLFIQFAETFAELEGEAVMAALCHGQSEADELRTEVEPVALGELDLFWNQAVEQLRLQMGKNTFESWIKETRLIAQVGFRFTIGVKNTFAKEWLENRLYTTIQRVVANLVKPPDTPTPPKVELEFLVGLSQASPESMAASHRPENRF
jgi:hypothetical protein